MLAVVVVDEAVLALSAYSLIDPMAIFYQSRAGAVREVRSRGTVKLADPMALELLESLPGGLGDAGGMGGLLLSPPPPPLLLLLLLLLLRGSRSRGRE